MASSVQILSALLLVALSALTWHLPRRFGLPGLFGAQILVAAGCFLLGVVSISIGGGPEDDPFVFVALLFQAVLLNFLLLPIALVGMWRRGRALTRRNRSRFGTVRQPELPGAAGGVLHPRMPLLSLAALGLPI